MHDEIERAPFRLDLGKYRIDGGKIGNVARQDDFAAKVLRQGNRAASECIPLVSVGDLGALAGEHARDAISDRPFVRDAHDEPALARH